MRTIVAFTIAVAVSFMMMPQFRASLGTALGRAGDATYEATLGSDTAQSVGKTIDALIGRGTPARQKDGHPAGG